MIMSKNANDDDVLDDPSNDAATNETNSNTVHSAMTV